MSEAANVLWLPCMGDCAIKESSNDPEGFLRLILDQSVGGILDSKDLRATRLVVSVGLDKLFWTFI